MDAQELRERIDSFPVWHYKFDFDGVSTPIFREDYANRHEQRRRVFFDPLVQVAGGTLRGKRVLDLGSNAGYWSLAAIEAGADFVFGIDGRQMHIDQAELVLQAKGIDPERYSFQLGTSSSTTSRARSTWCCAWGSCTTSQSRWSCSRSWPASRRSCC